MKKLYTLLAAATVVASASAAAPQLHNFNLNTPKTLAPNARVEASAEAFENFVSSRAVGDVTPAYTHTGIYYSSIFGWASEAFLTGEYDKVTNSVSEKGQLSNNTVAVSTVIVEGTTATIEGFADYDINIEGTYTPATDEFPAYVTVKASELSKVRDITDTNDQPTGEKICCYIYDTVNKKVSTDDVILVFNDEGRYLFWQTEFSEDAGQQPTIADATQRFVLANGTDPSAAGYKEYARTLIVEFDAVNAYMEFDAKFPGSTAFNQRRQYVWAQTQTFTDDKNPALGEQTAIDVFNIFAVFNSMTFAPAEFTVDFANKTATAYEVELASAGEGNPFLLFGYDEKGQEDSEFTMALSNHKTQSGEEITVMTAEKCAVADLKGQAGSVAIQNAQIELPFALDLNAAGIENVATENNAPVEYFNLQGVRVANPENGLYIRRQGNKVSKVLVK